MKIIVCFVVSFIVAPGGPNTLQSLHLMLKMDHVCIISIIMPAQLICYKTNELQQAMHAVMLRHYGPDSLHPG